MKTMDCRALGAPALIPVQFPGKLSMIGVSEVLGTKDAWLGV